jgi:hypothetical protein
MDKVTLHRDGSITFWSVIFQTWRKTTCISDAELASLHPDDRKRVLRQLARCKAALKAL